MSLSSGTRLGSYVVEAPLGAGGMGEVYRARDIKLNRDVALKVLPDLFASDPDRLARFTREAQTLAALNHPNIAHIHGLEEAGGIRALAIELVEGEDLSAIIARGPMPLAEALPIARQIADALEAAHEQGIVHRDLKPANIKIRPDGTVKVLDFGLAKALAPDGASATADAMHSPTLTMRATQMGVVLGTAAYMSPEQARGKPVDRRADIWAFGAVLYEMLTGRRAFGGDDLSITLASVLKDDPKWDGLPPDLPAPIARLLRRCLEKDPKRRLSAIGDARLELEEQEPAPVFAPVVRGRSWLGLAAAAALVAAAMTAGVMRRWPPDAPAGPAGVTRLSIALPDGDQMTETNLLPLAISPDGTKVVYVGRSGDARRLFLRRLAESEPKALAGTEGARSPFFSPDGQWIGFFAQSRLKKVAVASSAVQDVTGDLSDSRGAMAASDARGGTWSLDGNIYFAPANTSGLWQVPSTGGEAKELTRLDPARGEISHRWPEALPDRKTLIFTSWTGPGPDERAIVAMDLATGDRRTIVTGGDTPRYVSQGYLTYGRLDQLLALPWRPSETPRSDVAPISLLEPPRLENEGAADYALSATGTLVYLAGGAARYSQRVVWVDRSSGATEALPIPERDYEGVALSPDGQRAVVQVRAGAMDLWLYDVARRALTPFVTSGGSSQGPIWTTDGRRIIYRGTRAGTRNLYWKAVDGSGEEERLTTTPGVLQTPASVSPDGRWLVFSENGGPGRGASLWAMALVGDRTPRRLVPAAINGQVSPDGRWMAYQAGPTGEVQVYATSFPEPGGRIPISSDGGEDPVWSRDGRELFYTRGDRMMAVTVASSATLSVGAPRELFAGRFRPSVNGVTAFGVSPDGRRFLRVQQVQPERPLTRIEVVLNWASQLTTSPAR